MQWILVWLQVPTLALAQRDLKEIPDPDPEIERKSFQVADGFEVNLFAADPRLAKPIQMNWDAAGRLWVATSEAYPQILPGQTANDKIIVLQDTDGDGRADSTSVFADGLLIPTGIEPGDGGAYVANSTELLHLRDSDGDGKADTSRIVLSGFGTEDTHHLIHTFRWGPDGTLYFNQSIYIHSHVETPWGVRRLGGGGIWQFRPESARLEIFCRGFVNAWGHHFDDWGQSFATDGAYGEGINFVFPGATFFSAPGATRIVRGLNPGSPKHCGLEIVGGTHLPTDWQGNMVTNDFRGNRVCRFVVSEDGSGYASREQPELIKTNHVAFRPIDVKMGPDGAIYVADWYNPIIQHGEVDFRDPRRDHTRGRIWRITAKGRPLVKPPALVDASIDSLLESLKAPEPWTRHFAKRVLKERGAAGVHTKLAAWLTRLDRTDPRVEQQRLEALWTYQSIDVVEPKLLVALLRSPDHRVRAAATRVLAYWRQRLRNDEAPESVWNLLRERIADKHPRVRLEAIRALSTIPHPHAAELAMQALDQPLDRFLDFALWQAARDLQPYWLPVAQRANRSDQMGFHGNPKHLVFALQAVGSPVVVRPLVALLREGKVPAESEEAVLSLIGLQGNSTDLGLIFEMVVAEDGTPIERRMSLLESLIKASRQRKIRPSGELNGISRLLSRGSDDRLIAWAARGAGLWKVESQRPRLDELARTADASNEVRQAAMEAIASLGGSASRATLESLCASNHSIATRRMAIGALVELDLSRAAARAIEVLNESKSDFETSELYRSFLQRKEGPNALVKALSGRSLTADAAKIGVRQAKTSGRDLPELVEAVTKAAGLTDTVKQFSAEEMQQMARGVFEHGDPVRGEAIFRRRDLNCLTCHSIAGAGGLAGPDLVSIGASAPIDYLIDSLFYPNKQVKEGYHSHVVATNDGRVLTGIKIRQTDHELVLRDAENRDVLIPLNSIEETKIGGSIMPAGLTESLTSSELLDLVHFLALLGKTGTPYTVGPARVARTWQLLDPTPEMEREIRHAGLDALAAGTFPVRWSPWYSQVSGFLPLNEVPVLRIPYQDSSYRIVRCHIEVSTPGAVLFKLNNADGLRLWLDGSVLEPRNDLVVDLKRGRHMLTFAVPSGRVEGIRLELGDLPGSPAQAQFLNSGL